MDEKINSNSEENQQTVYPDDKNWADLTVDINDGWADDVPLNLPDSITNSANQSSPPEENSDISPTEPVSDTTNSNNSRIKERKNRISSFGIFMILWIILIVAVIGSLLYTFRDILTRYQAAYEASRPELAMEEYVQWFRDMDINSIYNQLTDKPAINQYEDETYAKAFMYNVISGNEITYKRSEKYTEVVPQYYIMAGDYIVSTMTLNSSPAETMDYGFPIWYIGSLDYYCEPQYDLRIVAPENVSVSINGIPLNENQCYEDSIIPDDAEYFGDYATLPSSKKYLCEGFYAFPQISAVNSSGGNCKIYYNTDTGLVEVDYGSSPYEEEMKQYAIEAVSAYSNYIANDVSRETFLSYFVPGSEIAKSIADGKELSGSYFLSHSKIEIQNPQIEELICYSPDAYYCEVKLDQAIYTWGTEPYYIEKVDGKFYFVKYNGSWKAVWMKF